MTLQTGVMDIEQPQRLSYVKLALPAALILILLLPVANRYTLAEEDLLRMMCALIYGNVSGDASMADFHPYGISFSFAWYELMQAITPGETARNPDALAVLINRLGMIMGMLCAIACSLYLNSIYRATAATATGILFFLSPVMLPVILSGHPIIPASACLFLAGWLLTFSEMRPDQSRWYLFVIALILLTLGLSLRAEIVLAFPFVYLKTKNLNWELSKHWRYFGLRSLLFTLAFAGFLVLQKRHLNPSEQGAFVLASFIEEFLSFSKIGRGLVVFCLSLGAATALAIAVTIVRKSRYIINEIMFLTVLALPALILFLPNPQPARHFFFPVLAVCLFAALLLEQWLKKTHFVLGISALIAVFNQIAIELAHPFIVSHSNYVQNYPSVTERRFSPAAPSGNFYSDQIAMQVNDDAERNEAILLAKSAPPKLLILADHDYYMLAHFLVRYPELRCSYGKIDGISYTQLSSGNRSYVYIEKYMAWPEDISAEALKNNGWQDWPVYVQPFTKTQYDRTEIPSSRNFNLNLDNNANF